MNNKKLIKVAVFFGANSPEHDVSIVTGLQAINALDPSLYRVIPVYITPQGDWLTGDPLLSRSNYMLNENIRNKLTEVILDLSNHYGDHRSGKLLIKNRSSLCKLLNFKSRSIEFDVALLALHGTHGEDGQIAALMELANIPYTGMRYFGSNIAMNKYATKKLLKTVGIPVLPDLVIPRPNHGLVVAAKLLNAAVDQLGFPMCVKPCNLGSSIGVARVNTIDELSAVLANIFKYDQYALLEPFIENLIEYNISVGIINNQVTTSAIEKPRSNGDLLDFKQKYLNGSTATNKFGSKSAGISEGMLAMTRELNPKLDQAVEQNLRNWAKLAFTSIHGTGSPRIDFLGNRITGEFWLNEINPCPGSFGFYLWEASEYKILFPELLNLLITEAIQQQSRAQMPKDPTPIEARLFPR